MPGQFITKPFHVHFFIPEDNTAGKHEKHIGWLYQTQFTAFQGSLRQRQHQTAFQITHTPAHGVTGIQSKNRMLKKRPADICQRLSVQRLSYRKIPFQQPHSVSLHQCSLQMFSHRMTIVLPCIFPVTAACQCNFHISAGLRCCYFQFSATDCYIGLPVPLSTVHHNIATEHSGRNREIPFGCPFFPTHK